MTAERLKQALELRDMKCIELSKRTGVNRGTISKYLSGVNEPRADRLHKIALALNVSEAWLLGYDVPMERNDMRSEIEYLFSRLSPAKQEAVLQFLRSLTEGK